MRTIIVGAGTIGQNLATALVAERHQVILIDSDGERQARLDGTIDCRLVTGHGGSPTALAAAGVAGCDLLIAVTGSDEVNLVACRIAQHFGVGRRIARLRAPDFHGTHPRVPLAEFGIDAAFSPEGLAVDLAYRVIVTPGAVEAADFADGRLALRGFVLAAGHPLLAGTLAEVSGGLPQGCRILARRRGDQALIPGGSDRLQDGDVVYVLGPASQVPAMSALFAPGRKAAESVVVFGAGIMGVELCRRLAGRVRRTVLFGPDPNRARRAAEQLDQLGVEVIEGSVLDLDLLRRVGVERADHLVTLSDDDENNLMAALLYRKYGHGTPILMTQKNHYAEMFEMLGFPMVIEPRAMATSSILRFLRGGAITAFTRLHHDDVDVIEARLTAASPLVGRALGELRPPGGMRVAAIIGDEVAIPDGHTVLTAGSRVLVAIQSAAGPEIRRWVR